MKKQQAMRMLFKYQLTKRQIVELWKNLPSSDYFSKESVRNIVWHTLAIMQLEASKEEWLIAIRPQSIPGYYDVLIYAKYNHDLLTRCAAILTNHFLTILNANLVATKNDYRLDTYTVYDHHPGKNQPDRIEKIKHALKEHFVQEKAVPEIQAFITKPVLAGMNKCDTEVYFHLDDDRSRTVMQLVSSDKPGLLARVGQVLSINQVRLQHAKISTYQRKAENVFFLTDDQDKPLSEDKIKPLKEKIIEALAEDN